MRTRTTSTPDLVCELLRAQPGGLTMTELRKRCRRRSDLKQALAALVREGRVTRFIDDRPKAPGPNPAKYVLQEIPTYEPKRTRARRHTAAT